LLEAGGVVVVRVEPIRIVLWARITGMGSCSDFLNALAPVWMTLQQVTPPLLAFPAIL
jgi:hypothetical protein